jgi:hypothetical protein
VSIPKTSRTEISALGFALISIPPSAISHLPLNQTTPHSSAPSVVQHKPEKGKGKCKRRY